MEGIDIEDLDCNTCLKMQEILSDEIDDPEFLEFAINNYPFFLSPMSYTPAVVERKS
jgi:hypothetical protein